MLQSIAALLGADQYSAHAICLTNDPVMIWLYVISNMAIWMSYLSIGVLLIARRGLLLTSVPIYLFASFIILCGLSHLTDVVTLFSGMYRLDLFIRLCTAVVSLVTAFSLSGWSRAIKNEL